jgi:uncharacterized protein (DUF1330 family)
LIRTADAVEPREAGLKQRVVVMEIESLERALATYNGAAYQAALRVLGSAGERDFRFPKHSKQRLYLDLHGSPV